MVLHTTSGDSAKGVGRLPCPYAAVTSKGWLRVNESLYLKVYQTAMVLYFQFSGRTYVTGKAPYCLNMSPSPFFSAAAASPAPASAASASTAAAWVAQLRLTGYTNESMTAKSLTLNVGDIMAAARAQPLAMHSSLFRARPGSRPPKKS